MPRYAEVPPQVHTDDSIPLVYRGTHEHTIAYEARVVDDHVERAERLDRTRYDT
jgi:hypothetical protein